MKVKRLTELALLTSAALIIFIIELRFPDIIPVPGVKLGLANIVTVYCVFQYTSSETIMLVACRVLLGAMFSGNWSALIYSTSGALMCLTGMLLLKHILTLNDMWLASVIGAMLHNTGQVLAQMAVMQSTAVISYLPVLMVSGTIAGLFTGLSAQLLLKRLKKSNIIK